MSNTWSFFIHAPATRIVIGAVAGSLAGFGAAIPGPPEPCLDGFRGICESISLAELDVRTEHGEQCADASANDGSEPWRTGSALVFDEARGLVYAADADRGTIHVFNSDLTPADEDIEVGERPQQLLVDPDGVVFATTRGGDVVRIGTDRAVTRTWLGGEPWGIARSNDGATLFVSRSTGDEVVALDSRTLETVWRKHVPPAPRALASLPSGMLALGHLTRGSLTMIDVATGNLEPDDPLDAPTGRVATRAQVLLPVKDGLLAFHDTANTGLGTAARSSGGYGGAQFEPPIMTDITSYTTMQSGVASPVARPSPSPNAFLGDVGLGSNFVNVRFGAKVAREEGFGVNGSAQNPSQVMAAVPLPLMGVVAFASLGTDELNFAPLSGSPAQLPFVHQIVKGGPSALAANASGTRLYVMTSFTREIRLFQVDGNHARPDDPNEMWLAGMTPVALVEMAQASLGKSGLPADVERGRELFHHVDRRISNSGFACASCHPDGREDGLVWNIEGARRATPSLAGRLAQTAPYNWEGTQPTLEGSIAQTIHRLGGTRANLTDDIISPLTAYLLRGLKPPDNPHRIVPKDHKALVAEGRAVFESGAVGCAGCHDAEIAFTDGAKHNVGTVGPVELASMKAFNFKHRKAPKLNTPSLRDLALTAPYLHDGSAPDLEGVLMLTDGHMGDVSKLVPHERKALLAYLDTL